MAAFLCIVIAFPPASRATPASGGRVWLALSDIHLDLFDRSSDPSSYGTDTNVALFEAALAEMKRAEPNPAVVLLPGDLLMHDFKSHLNPDDGPPDPAAIRTMRWLAAAFERAFPNAQFAIALGNNDIACGDYRSADGGGYLATVAGIWAPLVNRRGAAPAFQASFARGGFYAAQLPVPALRLVVLNTTPFSSQYRGDCAGRGGPSATDEIAWLRSTLHAAPPGTRNVVMMHIPPGFDPFSTEYVHGFLAWPFLAARYNDEIIGALSAPDDRVAYAVAGHTHHFDFRLARGVPIVVLGSLSPIFFNNPTFYALKVAADGSLRDIDEYAFDSATHAWLQPRAFDRTWGVGRVDAAALARLHVQLANDARMRMLWDRQNSGWASEDAVSHGTWGRDSWRIAWCAQALPTPSYAECAGIAVRIRILQIALAVTAVAAALLIGLMVVRARARS